MGINLTIILFFLFSILIFPQENQNKQDFTSANLIMGVPYSLKNNNFFSKPENISYAVIYKHENDSLYFISKKLNPDSNQYVLIFTSPGEKKNTNAKSSKIVSYNFLSFKKIKIDKIFTEKDMKLFDDIMFNVRLFYSPKDNIIRSQIIEKTRFPIISAVSKTKTEYDVFLELGIRDEMIFTFGNTNNPNPLPINIHFIFGIRFLKYYKIDFKAGFMVVSSDFEGMDEGVFLNADLFKTNIYCVLGLDFFGMMGQLAHGVSYSGGSFKFLCLGLGYSPSKHFDLEALFYIPQSRIIISQDPMDFQGTMPVEQINRGLIKIGFQYSFIF